MNTDFNNSIDKISSEEWESVFDLIPTIEQTKDFGEYIPMEKISDNFSIYKGFKSSNIVDEFVHRVYQSNIIISFDWMQWDKGKEIIESKTTDFSSFDKYTLCKLLVTHVRNDRFCDGWLVSCFDNGSILGILKALEKIIQSNK
jgi:hypothetical protein